MERELRELASMAMGRARQHVIAELETAATDAYGEAHRLGQRAKEEPRHAAIYVDQVAELTARGAVYEAAAEYLKRQAAAAAPAPSPMDAAMAGSAVLEPTAAEVAAALERTAA